MFMLISHINKVVDHDVVLSPSGLGCQVIAKVLVEVLRTSFPVDIFWFLNWLQV